MSVNYDWTPPAQTVSDSPTSTWTVPSGFVRQTAWSEPAAPPEATPPDLSGVYVAPTAQWSPMTWRWSDTWRRESIQRSSLSGGAYAWRFGIVPEDQASSGTGGGNPRAELFSPDPQQKRRATAPAAFPNQLAPGSEYWATCAIYIPPTFPTNHLWATLFQRKYDDQYVTAGGSMTWLSINVHGSQIDATKPGRADGSWESPIFLRDLGQCVGTWTRFTVHEQMNAEGTGLAEISVNGADPVTIVDDRPTFPTGDVVGHFQYGYYRSQFATDRQTRLAAGTALHSPLLIAATPSAPPTLP